MNIQKRFTSFGVIGIAFVSAVSAHADTKTDLAEVYSVYKKGDYTQAIDRLNRLVTTPLEPSQRATVFYWLGLCNSRMQNFSRAVADFKQAQDAKATFEDLDYELGQALYASQDLKPAREAFVRSAFRGYKPGASHYYAGFISQTLEEYEASFVSYGKIEALSEDPEGVRQAARYQLAEAQLAQIEARKLQSREHRQRVKTTVVPSLKKAIELDPESTVGIQAQRRLSQIQKQVGLEIPRMHNGVPIPEVPWYIKSSLDFKYDTNVISEADDSVTQVSDKDSLLIKPGVFGKYEFIHGRRWAIGPELDASYTRHLSREEPTVIQNDAFTLTPAVRTRNEHRLSGQAAAFLIELEYNQTWKDVLQNGSLGFYSRHYNLIIGERAKLLSLGSSTLLLNLKLYENTDAGQNATNPGLSFTQNWQLSRGMGLRIGLSGDYNRARNRTNDKINYKTSAFLNLPDLVAGIDANVGLDITLVDTRNQRATRGVEKTIAPSLSLTWNATRRLYMALSFAFTKNTSLDTATYAYTKSVAGLGVGYRF